MIAVPLSPATWHADPAHFSVEFIVRHLGVSRVRGRFNEFSAQPQSSSEGTGASPNRMR